VPHRFRTTSWRAHGHAARAAGFTLVELLVTVVIIALLLAVVLPTLGSTMREARGFRCKMSLRSIAFDFSVFADDQLHGDRGGDALLGPGRFKLETFQDSQYGIAEFWRWGTANSYTLPDAASNDPMRCSEVRGPITVNRGQTCGEGGAIAPPDNVSYGFNARLHRAEVTDANGTPRALPVVLTARVMELGNVPLVWDVDGAAAGARGSVPVFSAPSLDSPWLYRGDRFWYPGARHNGAVNIAFVGGQVVSSSHPLNEASWQWGYQPVR
jgi:prepilin-type N-terminal cleavage/methylation domain-containing protein/prepilin-type processing-associated H-X9-DG protein